MIKEKHSNAPSKILRKFSNEFLKTPFSPPAKQRDLMLDELPLSKRLESGLKRNGVQCLGDLDKICPGDLLALQNFGYKSLNELLELLERAKNGEFVSKLNFADKPWRLLEMIDRLMDGLKPRAREITLLRLGGKDGQKMTLEAVGKLYGFTRERIRQVVDSVVESVRRKGSRALKDWLISLEIFCHEEILPITPYLIEQWRQAGRIHLKYNPSFYVSLLSMMNPAIPAWPNPTTRRWVRNPVLLEVQRDLLKWWSKQKQDVPLADAYKYLSSKRKWEELSVLDFLEAVATNWRFQVDFSNPDSPMLVCPDKATYGL